ncbi:MAG: YfiR family protein, partial [Gammaproteobacteria bacterium]|nr:YfiR family protein [Gammaproteobacteria bacterium]
MDRGRITENKSRPDRRAGRAIRCCLAACIALACQGPAFSEEGSISEETLKVALVYKLTKFVEWPVEITGQVATFDICAGTGSPMAGPLMALGDRQTLGRPIRVRLLETFDDEEDARCDVVYLSDDIVEPRLRQHAADRHT